MRRIFFLLVLYLLSFCRQYLYGQNPDKNISKKDYYDFFNSFINPDSVHEFNLESRPGYKHIINDTLFIFKDTSLFSSADIEFIKFQIPAGMSFKWTANNIVGSNIISSKKISRYFKNDVDAGWTKFNNKYKNGFTTYSIALFSLDKKTCVVYTARHCGGLCGFGGLSVYKKVNGKWIMLKGIGMVWVS